MEQERYYFRVGLFVITCIAATIITLSWFATHRHKDRYLTYAIFFEGSVQGLGLGSLVTYKGINVGSVQEINFASYDSDLIRVLVDIIDTAPIRKDTRASLQIQGITGTSIISLENINPADAPIEYLTKEDEEPYMVIGSRQSGLEKVFTSIPELIEEITQLGEQGTKLLSDGNRKEVELLLGELRSLFAEGKVTMREVRMLAKTLRDDPSQLIRGPKYRGYEVEK